MNRCQVDGSNFACREAVLQVSLRLFLLRSPASLSVPCSPANGSLHKNSLPATDRASTCRVEQPAIAAIGKESGRQTDPEQLLPVAEPGALPPPKIDSNVIPAAHAETSGKYKISNQALAEAVAHALRKANLSKYEIDIDAGNGLVTLRVRRQRSRKHTVAGEAVSRVAGVTGVSNLLRVTDGAAGPDSVPERPSPFRDLFSSPSVAIVKQITLTGNVTIPGMGSETADQDLGQDTSGCPTATLIHRRRTKMSTFLSSSTRTSGIF